MLEVVLFFIMLGIILGIIGLMVAWTHFLEWRERRVMSPSQDQQKPRIAAEPPREPVRRAAVLPDTYQVEPGYSTSSADDDEPDELDRISRRMSDLETIALLAVQRKSDGSYRHSANAIATLIGGTRTEVLDRVREIRNPAEAVTPPKQQHAQGGPIYRPLDSKGRPVLN